MEKRVIGIVLTILGVVGLVYGGVSFVNGGADAKTIKTILFTGFLGLIFFFAGISLIRNTNDRAS